MISDDRNVFLMMRFQLFGLAIWGNSHCNFHLHYSPIRRFRCPEIKGWSPSRRDLVRIIKSPPTNFFHAVSFHVDSRPLNGSFIFVAKAQTEVQSSSAEWNWIHQPNQFKFSYHEKDDLGHSYLLSSLSNQHGFETSGLEWGSRSE